MAIITLADDVRIGPGSGFGLVPYNLTAESESTGAAQDRILGPSRWSLTLTQPATLMPEDADAWRALVASLRGGINRLAAWDVGREQPRGTMRGSPTLSGTHGAGVSALNIATGQAGCTLLPGDMLQLGTALGASQLVMVVQPATADGAGALFAYIEPQLRLAFATATPVAWWRPKAHFRLRGQGVSWRYGKGCTTQGITLDLLEAFT